MSDDDEVVANADGPSGSRFVLLREKDDYPHRAGPETFRNACLQSMVVIDVAD